MEVLPRGRRRRTRGRRAAGGVAGRDGRRRRLPEGPPGGTAVRRDHPGRDCRAAGPVRLLRAARVGHGLPAGQVRSPARVPAAAARVRAHRRGGGGEPDPVLALRRLPLLHPGRRSAEQHGSQPGEPARHGAAGLPARQHGPLQVGLQAVPAAAQRARHGLFRTLVADPGHGHAGVAVRLAEWGYPAIRIETPEGKAEYVEYQRAFSAESQELRQRLLQELAPLFQSMGSGPAPERTEGQQ